GSRSPSLPLPPSQPWRDSVGAGASWPRYPRLRWRRAASLRAALPPLGGKEEYLTGVLGMFRGSMRAQGEITMTTGGGDSAVDVGGPDVSEAGRGYLPASWDLEADVVVIGAGATGLPAAIAAIDAGASVLVVEANYDIGGHAILSGGNIPIGGGTS